MNDNTGAMVQAYITNENTDLYLFVGEITKASAAEFTSVVCARTTRRPMATLFLTSNGGDPHAAYRMAKALRRAYTTVRLLVAGPCKSAGTLIALGANEIAFANGGELGPLDVQLTKPDEIFVLGSGLDVLQALKMITDSAFESFEQFMVNLGARSGGAISTKMAADVAGGLATKLFEPISAQIDPMRLGEVQRAIRIARAYGERLSVSHQNLKAGALDSLIDGYPSHGFVIDMEEAKKLFVSVTELSPSEAALVLEFPIVSKDPSSSPISADLGELFPPPQAEDATKTDNDGNTPHSRSAETIEPVSANETRAPSGNGTGAAPGHAENAEPASV